MTKYELPGHRVLIEPKPLEEKTESGIVLARPKEQELQERRGSEEGTVVAVGPTAWHFHDNDSPNWKPWAQVGDKVVFVRYAGRFVNIDEKEYIVINDEDILLVKRD